MKPVNKLIENKIHPKIRLNGICPYFTMFPLSFPFKVLRKAKSGCVVYDPFCGRGTTNYAARLLGLNSYGVDSSPVAAAVAQCKLVNANPNDIALLCNDILEKCEPGQVPNGQFWEWAFHSNTLIEICKIKNYFISKKELDKVEIALRAILLGILHGPIMKTESSYLSNQMPRTFATKPEYSVKYWSTRSLTPKLVNTLALVSKRANYIFNEQIPRNVPGKVFLGDSRTIGNVSEEKFDWVITSPPYYGMTTYIQDQWLRIWFLGGGEDVEYSTRSQLKHYSENSFIKDLSKVWTNTASKCNNGARLAVRFGAIPSKADTSPSDMFKKSLALSNSGWKLQTIVRAGISPNSKRQANQFFSKTSNYIEEIDAFAILNP
jgi:hypothetical protein